MAHCSSEFGFRSPIESVNNFVPFLQSNDSSLNAVYKIYGSHSIGAEYQQQPQEILHQLPRPPFSQTDDGRARSNSNSLFPTFRDDCSVIKDQSNSFCPYSNDISDSSSAESIPPRNSPSLVGRNVEQSGQKEYSSIYGHQQVDDVPQPRDTNGPTPSDSNRAVRRRRPFVPNSSPGNPPDSFRVSFQHQPKWCQLGGQISSQLDAESSPKINFPFPESDISSHCYNLEESDGASPPDHPPLPYLCAKDALPCTDYLPLEASNQAIGTALADNHNTNNTNLLLHEQFQENTLNNQPGLDCINYQPGMGRTWHTGPTTDTAEYDSPEMTPNSAEPLFQTTAAPHAHLPFPSHTSHEARGLDGTLNQITAPLELQQNIYGCSSETHHHPVLEYNNDDSLFSNCEYRSEKDRRIPSPIRPVGRSRKRVGNGNSTMRKRRSVAENHDGPRGSDSHSLSHEFGAHFSKDLPTPCAKVAKRARLLPSHVIDKVSLEENSDIINWKTPANPFNIRSAYTGVYAHINKNNTLEWRAVFNYKNERKMMTFSARRYGYWPAMRYAEECRKIFHDQIYNSYSFCNRPPKGQTGELVVLPVRIQGRSTCDELFVSTVIRERAVREFGIENTESHWGPSLVTLKQIKLKQLHESGVYINGEEPLDVVRLIFADSQDPQTVNEDATAHRNLEQSGPHLGGDLDLVQSPGRVTGEPHCNHEALALTPQSTGTLSPVAEVQLVTGVGTIQVGRHNDAPHCYGGVKPEVLHPAAAPPLQQLEGHLTEADQPQLLFPSSKFQQQPPVKEQGLYCGDMMGGGEVRSTSASPRSSRCAGVVSEGASKSPHLGGDLDAPYPTTIGCEAVVLALPAGDCEAQSNSGSSMRHDGEAADFTVLVTTEVSPSPYSPQTGGGYFLDDDDSATRTHIAPLHQQHFTNFNTSPACIGMLHSPLTFQLGDAATGPSLWCAPPMETEDDRLAAR